MKLKPIKDKKKIEKIFEKGTLLRGSNISIKFYNFNDNKSCYGLAVPKKNFPLAVSRNLIKRRLREQLQLYIRTNTIKKGVSFFLIYTSKEIISSSDLKDALESLVKNFDSGVK